MEIKNKVTGRICRFCDHQIFSKKIIVKDFLIDFFYFCKNCKSENKIIDNIAKKLSQTKQSVYNRVYREKKRNERMRETFFIMNNSNPESIIKSISK